MHSLTVSVQIGNSDNKLTQVEWARFVSAFKLLSTTIGQCHFLGFSEPTAEWQNACFIVEVDESEAHANNWDDLVSYIHGLLDYELARFCKEFKQDSIALTIGTTQFITEEQSNG